MIKFINKLKMVQTILNDYKQEGLDMCDGKDGQETTQEVGLERSNRAGK